MGGDVSVMITEQRWMIAGREMKWNRREKRRKVRNKHKENKVSSAITCHGEKSCGDKRKKKEKRT